MTTKPRYAPAHWEPGCTRVRDEDGQVGTFVGNSEPLPGVTPHGTLGVLVRFDDEDEPVDVYPETLTVLDTTRSSGSTPAASIPDDSPRPGGKSGMNIKAIVFDHGGVLSRGGEKGTNERAASRGLGLTDTIVIPDLNEALKIGRIDNAEYVEQINERFPDAPRRLTMSMWDDVYATLAPDRLAYDFAQRCRDAGLRTAILTSINPGMAVRLKNDGSYDGFDPLIMSCYVGCAKPDPAIYRLVEDGLPGIRPAEIMFLDDQDKCCNGARRVGWQAIRVDSSEQMIRDVSELLGLEAQ